MKTYWQRFFRFLKREDGPTAVEYAVLLALIILVALAAINTFGQTTANSFSNSSKSITDFMGS